MIVLTDDGSLDTVLICTVCREEFRGNYHSYFEDTEEYSYDNFIDWFIEEITAEHECEVSE